MLRRSVRATLAAASRLFSTETAAEKAVITEAGRKKVGRGRDTLGRRLLTLVYPKRSAVIAIQKWKEDGHTVRKYELYHVVKELRKLKRYKHALEICEWVKLQQDMKLLPGDYAVHLDLVAKVRGLNSAEKFFEDIPEQMKEEPTYTALLHSYVQNKLSAKAEALMEKMSDCGFLKYPLPYNHMISLYISEGQLEKIPEMLERLKKTTTPSIFTYNLLLSLCAMQNDVKGAEKAFLELKEMKLDPDWVTYSALTNLYVKNELHENASSMLKEMEKRVSRENRVSYSSLLSLHTNIRDKDEVRRIWKMMKSCFRKMNDAEYTCMISSLVKLEEFKEAEDLYSEWEAVSQTGDTRVPNIILAAQVNRGQIETGKEFYRRMVKKGITPSNTTWEILAWGYLKHKDVKMVLEWFEKATGSVKKWSPNVKLVKEVFKKLEEEGNIEGAEKLLVILRKGGHVSTEVYNLLLQTYAKAGKMPLIVAERMEMDNVDLDEETHELIKLTSKMCVSEVPVGVS